MSITITQGKLITIFSEHGFTFDLDPIADPKANRVDEDTQALYQKFGQNPFHFAYELGFIKPDATWTTSLHFTWQLAECFLRRLSRTPDLEYLREAILVHPTKEDIDSLLAKVPFTLGTEFITEKWLIGIFERLNEVFSQEIKLSDLTVADYLLAKNGKFTVFGRVFFHLVENKTDDLFPFAFLATYSTGQLQDRRATHTPLKNALLEYKGQDELLLKLLSTVSSAAEQSALISRLVESGELFSPLKLTSEEAYTFLKEVPLYEDSGILCRIPDFWKRKTGGPRLSIQIGDQKPAQVGLDALLEFNPTLFLGDEPITLAEIRALMAQTSGLSLIKGKWVEVDQAKLQAALEAYEKAQELAQSGLLTMAEAMRLQLNLEQTLGVAEVEVPLEITNGKWLREIISKLESPPLIEDLEPNTDFKATLRPYQQEGLNWLNLMQELGLGACLADDMGLGKTVQVLALLEKIRTTTKQTSLLIIPASLMGNWQKELERFAPKLSYKAIYSSKDQFDSANPSVDLVITTYGIASRLETLQTYNWDLLILDEAQAIKNPLTKQTKTIKQFKARAKIALTGTPIENRLTDLWSLFDFLNGGLLGSAKEFKQLTKNLGQDGKDYARLREVINPFILRRLKTDKTIISDLPEKIELNAYTELTKKQVILYQGLVKKLATGLESAEGIGRKGLVLASIMKAKQICNHPDQYLGQTEFSPKLSGKFHRLQELCATIAEKRERVLVFTQFREMTEPLARFLAALFGREGLILHGQTPARKRTELVKRFNDPEYVPYMVLSLRAGGVGLNLTAANHVIHFDRWWNPAVENQATDRAFRIGQKKNVLVHKFTTRGTIEEKIEQMIEDKSDLATEVLASTGESRLTELGNKELLELFTLSSGGAS